MAAGTEVALPAPSALLPPARRLLHVQTPNDGVVTITVEPSMLVKHVERHVQRVTGAVTALRLSSFSNGSGEEAALPRQEACCDLVADGDVLLATASRVPRTSSSPQLSSPLLDAEVGHSCQGGAQEDGPSSAARFGNPHRADSAFVVVGSASARSRNTKRLLEACEAGLAAGHAPKLETEGLGGTYLLRGGDGQRLAMFKPLDEEPFAPNNPKGFVGKALGAPGVSRAVRVGEAAFREVAAFLLDHERFSRVPRTALVRIHHDLAAFHVNTGGSTAAAAAAAAPVVASMTVRTPSGAGPRRAAVPKLGSLQVYVRHDYDASEHGTSRFPAVEVHRLGILDVRLYNTDRHTGNILVCRPDVTMPGTPATPAGGIAAALEGDGVELVPIDHGYCLPDALESVYFEWLHWPQASMPFSKDTLAYIDRLDGDADAQLLARELPCLRPGCGRLIQLTTRTLQAAAAAGLCLADIGGLLSRPVVRIGEEPSPVERLVESTLAALAESLSTSSTVPVAVSNAVTPLRVACRREGDNGWGEDYPLGELSEGDEDAAAASTPMQSATPAGGIARALAAAGGSSLKSLLAAQQQQQQDVIEDTDPWESNAGTPVDGDETTTGSMGSSPSGGSCASPAGTPTKGLPSHAALAPSSASSAMPVPVPMRRTHSMPLSVPLVAPESPSGAEDGGWSSTSSSFGIGAPDSPSPAANNTSAAAKQHTRHHGGAGQSSSRHQHARGGVGSAPHRPTTGPTSGRPAFGGGAHASHASLGRDVGQAVAVSSSVGIMHTTFGKLATPQAHGQGTAAVDADIGAAAGSACGISSHRATPWASFSEVPQSQWRAFLRIFECQLYALLDAHPANRRTRMASGDQPMSAAGDTAPRGNQLVTRDGTRVEAFGTSCPSVWLAERQGRRATGGPLGWR